MSKRARNRTTHRRRAARTGQHAFVRVVVGSLVLYAALGTLAPGSTRVQAAHLLQAVAQQDASAQKRAHVKIDSQPLRELLAEGRRAYRAGELDLGETLELTIEADRAADGTFSDVKFSHLEASNERLAVFARDFLRALSASHVLERLDEAHHLNLNVKLDGERFAVHLLADTATEASAAKLARSYGLMLMGARIVKRGADEQIVLNNMTATSSGKQLSLSLDMPRQTLGNLLLKHLNAE